MCDDAFHDGADRAGLFAVGLAVVVVARFPVGRIHRRQGRVGADVAGVGQPNVLPRDFLPADVDQI